MFPTEVLKLAEHVINAYKAQDRKLVTAESCTGGLVAGTLTNIPGSSAVIERGFITYTNNAKVEVLGVRAEALNQFGAVSACVAEQMAQGALEFSHADVAISVTGIAGPDGGSADKPVGLVYFGVATSDGVLMHYKSIYSGNRETIRMQAVHEALKLILSVADRRDMVRPENEAKVG